MEGDEIDEKRILDEWEVFRQTEVIDPAGKNNP
jgi:hypothetical protein